MQNFLRIVAIFMIIAVLIGGFVAGFTQRIGQYPNDSFNLLLMLGIFVAGCIPSLILLGIANILDKLDMLNKNKQ